jgi:hypothetical protein
LNDVRGEVRTSLSAKRAEFILGAIPAGGLDTFMQGRIAVLRDVDTSISVRTRGRVLSKSTSVQTGGFGGLTLLTDGTGRYSLALGGRLRVRGSVHPSGPPTVF